VDPAVQEPADEDLMLAVAGRDEAAFETLYDRYAPLVYALCLRILRRHNDAQSVVSDVFWEVWQRAERFNPNRGTARTYLLTLARSRAVDRIRANSSRVRRETEAGREREEWSSGTAADPSVAVVVDEDRQAVVAALAELNESQRRTLHLAYFGGMTHREIAAELSMPLGSVKTCIRQGLIRLRQAMECAAAGRSDQ
jgi:RNA polymerase sigma-70 factor (ECF subfamily)